MSSQSEDEVVGDEAEKTRAEKGLVAELEEQEYLTLTPEISLVRRTYRLRHRGDAGTERGVALVADEAAESLRSIRQDIGLSLRSIRPEIRDPSLIASLEANAEKLAELSERMIEHLRRESRASGIEPRLSVVRPHVRLIDANLAYRYADLQSDVNLLHGFTTLFLGAGLASTTSLIVSLLSRPTSHMAVAIHSCFALFSFIAALIFWCLTRRAQERCDKSKLLLEAETGVDELMLEIVEKQGPENTD